MRTVTKFVFTCILTVVALVVVAQESAEQLVKQIESVHNKPHLSSAGTSAEELESAIEPEETNKNIERKIGQTFNIDVPANPSTGYSWYWLVDQSIKDMPAALVNRTFIAEHSSRAGAPGVTRFTFRAIRSGQMDIMLYNKRIWEKNSDIDMKRFKVTIK